MSGGFVRGGVYEDRFGTLFLCRREDGVMTELCENGPLNMAWPARLVGLTREHDRRGFLNWVRSLVGVAS